MRQSDKTSRLAILATLTVCGALAAAAYERPWMRGSATAAQTSSDAASASPSEAAAASSDPIVTAAAPSRQQHTAVPGKVIGTIENVDPPNRRFILKMSGGESEAFRLAKWSVVLKHRRKLAFSALRAGESVIVERHPGSNAATRVYVLGDDKS